MDFETVEIVVRSAGKPFAESVDGAEEVLRPTPLGLVVCEHVDKIGFFEPSVAVIEKELLRDGLQFVLRLDGALRKPIEEIVRGFKIGCFRIAREYGLVREGDGVPIFRPEFEVGKVPAVCGGLPINDII